MSAVVHTTTFDKAWLRGSRSFEEDRDLIVWHKLWVVFVVYHVNALNVESVRFSRIICRFLVWLCFECQAIRHKEVLHGGVLQLRHYQIVVKQWNWQLVGLPLILSWILSVNNVTDVLLILVANANLDVQAELARILRWLHRHSQAIVPIELLFDQVDILEPAKHHVVHQLQALTITDEFCAHTQIPIFLIVQELGLAETTKLCRVG